ncbi:MAG: type II toxin-antitoxin system VapC family toxin [Clostridia bacterium]|nr:type II toxin-antitoxin system VapC family toxin [Clostridia bacterium]
MIKVFDAYAVLCWMQEEPGSTYIDYLMEEAEKGALEIHISAINVGEIFYRLIKSGNGKDAASYADAFALALANETGGEIVTRDPEIVEVCNGGSFRLDQIPLVTTATGE